ncbi:cell filamentation protein Fic [Spirochaetia bacterium]|nr:cell filamentation protein Fic [Spirochaetia bacterium]
MRNNYEYLDPDYSYTDSKTGILKNLGGITNYDDLVNFESIAVTKRRNELLKQSNKINDSDALFAIHRHLFQDVYAWAGRKRTVEISKGGKQFFPIDHFEAALIYIDNLVFEYKELNRHDVEQISKKLAEILDMVNYLHPFREGNGRTQREFIRILSLEKGFEIDLNPPDNPEIYERYMSGTINGDIPKLQDLLLELMEKGLP